MPDITAFLAARYDETEAIARDAIGEDGTGRWSNPATAVLGLNRVDPTEATFDLITFDDGRIATHIATHDPARVLAEVAAKRRHIVMWQEAHAEGCTRLTRINAAPVDDDKLLRRLNIDYYEALGMLAVAEKVLRLDANVYAEHPDYDPAWSDDA